MTTQRLLGSGDERRRINLAFVDMPELQDNHGGR